MMEEELTIVIAAVMTYLGLPPERLDISEFPVRNVVLGARLQASKQPRLTASHARLNDTVGQAWKWSLPPLRKSNVSQGNVSLKQRVSTWRQIAPP